MILLNGKSVLRVISVPLNESLLRELGSLTATQFIEASRPVSKNLITNGIDVANVTLATANEVFGNTLTSQGTLNVVLNH